MVDFAEARGNSHSLALHTRFTHSLYSIDSLTLLTHSLNLTIQYHHLVNSLGWGLGYFLQDNSQISYVLRINMQHQEGILMVIGLKTLWPASSARLGDGGCRLICYFNTSVLQTCTLSRSHVHLPVKDEVIYLILAFLTGCLAW